jgi:hypothetical protein
MLIVLTKNWVTPNHMHPEHYTMDIFTTPSSPYPSEGELSTQEPCGGSIDNWVISCLSITVPDKEERGMLMSSV